jgi:outer membrane protein OmpA-like peptidoglycan-associated protein/uncharacterized protein YidB (DUF937 family)
MFDVLIREVASRFGLGDKAGPLLQMLLAFMTNKESGGLSGFLGTLRGAGHGDIVQSWLGGGADAKAISGDQVQSLLGGGGGLLQGMASRFGLGSTAISGAVAYLLPGIIGKLTPGGSVPSALPAEVGQFVGSAGSWLSGLSSTAMAGVGAAGATAGNAADAGGAGFLRWLPWIIGAAALAWILSTCSQKPPTAVAPPAPTVKVPTPAPAPAPKIAEPASPAPVPAVAMNAAPAAAKLYFASGSPALPGDASNTLKDVVAYLQKNASAKAAVTGYHDETGSVEVNQELAKNRAKNVREALKAAGVAEDRIAMEKPVVSTGSGDLAEARRVEVSVKP